MPTALLLVLYIFLPIVVEALGGWSEEAVFHISKIGRLIGQRLGLPPNETTKHLFQRLAIYLPVEGECIAMLSPFSSTVSMGGWKHLTLSPSPRLFLIFFILTFMLSLSCFTVLLLCIDI